MPIKTVNIQMHKTSDGELHENWNKAVHHEKRYNLLNLLRKYDVHPDFKDNFIKITMMHHEEICRIINLKDEGEE